MELKPSVKWSRDHPVALGTSASGTPKMNDSEKKVSGEEVELLRALSANRAGTKGRRDGEVLSRALHEPWGETERGQYTIISHTHHVAQLRT